MPINSTRWQHKQSPSYRSRSLRAPYCDKTGSRPLICGGSARRALPRHASDARRDAARGTGRYAMKLALSERFRVFQRALAVDDRLRFVNRCIQRPVFLTIPLFLEALNGDLHGLLSIIFARDKHEAIESEY